MQSSPVIPLVGLLLIIANIILAAVRPYWSPTAMGMRRISWSRFGRAGRSARRRQDGPAGRGRRAVHAARRAVIVGAGAIGVEFATMWRPMGTEVTIVEALDRVLPLEDADSSALLQRALRRHGIEVVTGVSGRVRDAVEAHKRGEYRASVQPSVPSHFGTGGWSGRNIGGPGSPGSERELEQLKAQLQALQTQLAEIQSKIEQLERH